MLPYLPYTAHPLLSVAPVASSAANVTQDEEISRIGSGSTTVSSSVDKRQEIEAEQGIPSIAEDESEHLARDEGGN